jgi:hypothetical protein
MAGAGTGAGKGTGAGTGAGEGTGAGTGAGEGTGAGTGAGEGTGAGTGAGEGTGAGTGAGEGTGAGTGSRLPLSTHVKPEQLFKQIKSIVPVMLTQSASDVQAPFRSKFSTHTPGSVLETPAK